MTSDIKHLNAYQTLCTQYYDYDKPTAEVEALNWYQSKAAIQKGPILEPMCGTGRFLIPFLSEGYDTIGFDNSKQMLKVCHDRCEEKNIDRGKAVLADFESFKATTSFDMIFIPSGSFCLLTTKQSVDIAMSQMHSWLNKSGRLYFEIDTIHSVEKDQGLYKAAWVDKEDKGKIVLSYSSLYCGVTQVQRAINKYELWENNKIVNTEVEEFNLKLYRHEEVQNLLEYHGFELVKATKPYTDDKAGEKDKYVLYEVRKV
ncbi:MAG: class I SAM-dependent methyltransferase [Proteobacteria bacterium]|nr:class I SAM-dependent methyltransferase [Pseudomonadota bacterium]